jgi:deferrochelatase/peroxidase EfeB
VTAGAFTPAVASRGAGEPDEAAFAAGGVALAARWMLDGFRTAQRDRDPRANTRNLFAFGDGTANPPTDDAAMMERLVWSERGAGEFQDPDFASDPNGRRIPLSAHIRLANPRAPQTADQRMIRPSYNYDRGVDAAGDLDCGLIFTAYNQNPRRQFRGDSRSTGE